mmetsp:Transcript_2902/g.3110  ORF Transcript_2902/g.3110 Transcript_2902/m.3110 type:complete len:509 (+) Transcript_2902:111-1637(+)|eukprot:CAMPEP_0173157112 /NCGR_PEP_ID=MMETSP1105-20130129/15346_1 /TAXON_ID=2985 /ORGANISM="Ochromonas sp., Strain BG-1" /LENGTH=508 /DNA_ID=CAMNT_0014074345 /DNA_START=17 /DNA_END=1543 /DNA_ORIENTATION=+
MSDTNTDQKTEEIPTPTTTDKREEEQTKSEPINVNDAPVASSSSIIDHTNDSAEAVSQQLQNMTIFGNKSLDELHRIQAERSHLSAGILFNDPALRIPRPILESLTLEMRFEKPSAIQASSLPLIFDGKNMIAQAQSGAGKTIAFVIGMLSRIDPRVNAVQALCLTPTREIAIQIVDDAVRPLSTRIPGIRYELGITGVDVESDSVSTAHLIVGTPGTVKRWIKDGYLPTKGIRIFVLDEADTMVSVKTLGADTMAVKQKIPPTSQFLLFSATYTDEIMDYAQKIVPNAYTIRPPKREELVLDVIFQVWMDVRKARGGKLQVLKDIYSFLTLQQSIVFVEMKREADAVASMMRQAGFEVSVLHGDIPFHERDRVMRDFRAGKSKVLIATNALARGVDVPAVAAVVNFDLPFERLGQKVVADPSTYLHRIGRCGRFGRRGTAINFLESPKDFEILGEIEKYFRRRMAKEWDPNDIEGLSDAIKERPEGGEIIPEAEQGNSVTPSGFVGK